MKMTQTIISQDIQIEKVGKYINEGKSLRIVLSVFGETLRDEIKICYQCCLSGDDCPLITIYRVN